MRWQRHVDVVTGRCPNRLPDLNESPPAFHLGLAEMQRS